MLDKIRFTPRIWFLLLGLSCFAMLGVGAYLQFVEHLEPCPLCISQRIALFCLGIVFLIAAIHNPTEKGIKIYSVLSTLTAIAGGSISIRHIWLQHLPPDEVPECTPGDLSFFLENFPLTKTIKLMLSGTGECAKVDWTLLGLSIPELTLMAFVGLATVGFLQIWNIKAV